MTPNNRPRPILHCPACGTEFVPERGPFPKIPDHHVKDPRETPAACWLRTHHDKGPKYWCYRSGTYLDPQHERSPDARHAVR